MAHSLRTVRVYNKNESIIDNLEQSVMPGLRLACLTIAQECENNQDNQHLEWAYGTILSCLAAYETIADGYEEELQKKRAEAPEVARR